MLHQTGGHPAWQLSVAVARSRHLWKRYRKDRTGVECDFPQRNLPASGTPWHSNPPQPGAVPATLTAFRHLLSCEPNCFAPRSVLLASILAGSSKLHSLQAHGGGRAGGKPLRRERRRRGILLGKDPLHQPVQPFTVRSQNGKSRSHHCGALPSSHASALEGPRHEQCIQVDCPKHNTVKRETISEEENAQANDFQHDEVSFSSRGPRSLQSPQGQSLSKIVAPGT